MNAEIAMYMAQVLNTGAFIALAVWYVVPRLRNLSRGSALMALTAVHLGRTLALAVYSSVARQSGWEHSDNQDGHFGGRGERIFVAAR